MSGEAIRDLTREEARELSWARTQAWLKNQDDVRPFTPEEARWNAREFIAHNSKRNLVRLLAEAFLELQDSTSAAALASLRVQVDQADGMRKQAEEVAADWMERATTAERERDAQEKTLAACARLLGDEMPRWAPMPVREIGCERCEQAERELAACREALQEIVTFCEANLQTIHSVQIERIARASLGGMADDGPEERNPAFDCTDCDGAGWYTAAEHEPRCDGSCDFCPIPVQRECETCGGSGNAPSEPPYGQERT